MRPIHMTIGDRHLVRLEVPGGVRVVFEDAGRERGPAVRRALAAPSDTTEPINHFSAAALKARSDEATAEIFRPLHRALVALALGALVLAAAFTTVSLARLDRQIAVEARV